MQPLSDTKAYIALGSNVGDRLNSIEDALQALNQKGLRVTRTSNLYETAPMYVEDQDRFYNAVCEVDIPGSMTPLALLDTVKDIEDELGRVKTIEKGPRAIDLDILTFGRQTVQHERLIVPHHSISEREFVLRPLADLIPNSTLPGWHESVTVRGQLDSLPRDIHHPVVPMNSSTAVLKPGFVESKTLVMGILNVTPDSFSDGGENSLNPKSDQMQRRLQAWSAAGAEILDIGGQSTAPNAAPISAREEMDRVLPLIRHIRSLRQFDGVMLSIDTFRASVARAAVEAGANIVNDVSGGTLDGDMLATVAGLRVPYILMHMRGDPSTMGKLNTYPDGLLPTIARELRERVDAAMAAGIPRWRIVLDPGIGFAKQKDQNITVLRHFSKLRNFEDVAGFAWLIGTSRKKFIGHILGEKQADARDWGTAAAVTSAMAGGADIVRIHNEKLVQTVTVLNAILRGT